MTAAVSEDLERARTLAPGPELAAVLVGIDDRYLDHNGLLEVIAAWSRLRSWAEARELRATACVAGPPDEQRPANAALLGSRLHLAHHTALDRLDLAWTLATERPWTMRALHRGQLSLAHARVIIEELRNLDLVHADTIERSVLDDAPDRTAASLRRTIRRKVLAIDPQARTRRHKQAVKDRCTWIRDLGDGMAEFGARLPAAQALRCREAVNTRARELRTPHDERTTDQRRADAFTDLITGGQAPTIELILRANHDQPVTVPGYGPLDADSLRELATGATILLRPLGPVPTGVNTYRPSAGLDRWIRAHDPTCRFPGCTVKAKDCDLDHVIPWHRGGKTRAGNLMPLCRKDHRLKTFHHWTPVLNPTDPSPGPTPSDTNTRYRHPTAEFSCIRRCRGRYTRADPPPRRPRLTEIRQAGPPRCRCSARRPPAE